MELLVDDVVRRVLDERDRFAVAQVRLTCQDHFFYALLGGRTVQDANDRFVGALGENVGRLGGMLALGGDGGRMDCEIGDGRTGLHEEDAEKEAPSYGLMRGSQARTPYFFFWNFLRTHA